MLKMLRGNIRGISGGGSSCSSPDGSAGTGRRGLRRNARVVTVWPPSLAGVLADVLAGVLGDVPRRPFIDGARPSVKCTCAIPCNIVSRVPSRQGDVPRACVKGEPA
jgi:hypothetical protein